MLTLGIETSCDETGASVTDGRKVLSNVVSSSVHLHKKYGGVVPEIASRFHLEFITEVVDKALSLSGKRLKNIRLVAATNGPGLVGALLTGLSMAKSIAYSSGLPLIGVNHILAHLYSSFLAESPAPPFPFTGLVVSGGHTALFYCEDIGKQKLLGQTQDDAVGEAYDKVSKLLGLGYPGGPVIERAARLSAGTGHIRFPRSFLEKGSLDFSFSGLKTAVLYYVRGLSPTGYGLRVTEINDICYEFQEAVLDVLVDKALRAAQRYKTRDVVLGGGVAINRRLREKFRQAETISGIRAYFPDIKYCLDNAAMVGYLGESLYKKGCRSDLYLSAEPNLEVADA
jgi:N6-L-threonylcarbamoyladenine synthase